MSEGFEKLRVAYLGPKGSFTHQAALQSFPDHTLVPHVDFLSIFTAVHSKQVDRGVIPVENSTNGFVVQILDHLAASKEQYPHVKIVDETFVAVQQSLLGRRQQSETSEDTKVQSGHEEPAINLEHINTLYSHPQAWGQCTPFLTQHFRKAERIDTTSTSRAAELVAQDPSGTSAAICSPLAADLYGLDTLVPSIEERRGNTTRFLILQNVGTIADIESRPGESTKYKTLIGFTVQSQPSSLANALAVFGKYGINFTSLNSRPRGGQKWKYIFFVEFWGNQKDPVVEEALQEVGATVETWEWFGSWKSKELLD